MQLHDVHQGVASRKSKKRIGRGPGSGQGKTAGRGHKGQRSRAGSLPPRGFEGGQMPLARRIPKRGFNNRWRKTFVVVNLAALVRNFEAGATVDTEGLLEAGLVKGRFDGVKILGNGELTKSLTVESNRFSKTAQEKIEKSGGTVVIV